MCVCVCGWMDVCVYVWMDGWMDVCMYGWVGGWMDGCVYVCILLIPTSVITKPIDSDSKDVLTT